MVVDAAEVSVVAAVAAAEDSIANPKDHQNVLSVSRSLLCVISLSKKKTIPNI